MPAKCNVNPLRGEALLKLFQAGLTVEEEQELTEHFEHYLFYHNLPHNRRAYLCTHCGDLWISSRTGISHNRALRCPHCNHDVTSKAAGRLGGSTGNYPSLAQQHNAVFLRPGPDGSLLVSAGLAHVTYEPMCSEIQYIGTEVDGLVWPSPRLAFYERRRYYMAPGELASWKRWDGIVQHFGWNFGYDCTPWESTKSAGEPVAHTCWTYPTVDDGEYLVFGWEAIGESALRYSQCELYFSFPDIHRQLYRNVVSYLAWYCIRPQMEMLYKLGYEELIDELISRGSMSCRPNLMATNPAAFFRLSKQEWNAFRASGASTDVLTFWPVVRKELTLQEYLTLGCVRYLSRDRLSKVQKSCAELGLSLRHVLGKLTSVDKVQLWLDYIDMGRRLNLDLSREDVALPKNLRERHDACARQIEYMDNVEKMKKYRRRLKKLKRRYAFEAAGWLIRVPESGSEIRVEGRTLHHCVAAYADRHLDGETTILFLRSVEEPDTPLCTIEMDSTGEKIRQIHGYQNDRGRQSPTVLYADLLNLWLPWLKAGSPRDSEGNPIIAQKMNTEQEAG